MSGFSLYETLRIFVPGALGVLIADLTVRLATGPDVFAPAPGFATDVVETLESTGPFAGLALFLGLLLYLVDLPTRTRIYGGDPDQGSPLPTRTLGTMLSGTGLEDDALGLYFVLSDKYLPEEMHRRVYLFGSLFRVYVDLRVLAATALVGGTLLAVISARRSAGLDELGAGALAFVAAGVALAIVAAVALFGARAQAVRGRPRSGAQPATPVGPSVVILGLGALAVVLGLVLEAPAAYVSLVPGGAALAVWWAIEIGPPAPSERTWRAAVFERLGVDRVAAPQFSVAQRVVTELALVAPPLAAASAAAVLQGRPEGSVIAWALLAVPATAIMSIRKHERRLLGIYADQSRWLELQKPKIMEIARTGTLPDKWE